VAKRLEHSRIQQARLAARLTQKELGARLGYAATTVQNWELGNRNPSADDTARIAEACGVPIGMLYGEPEPPPADPDPIIARIIDGWPPLTMRQRQRLASILTGAAESSAHAA
jgi:transcriptional regulator with XRE-family HTH domain